jgi:hypothetical protein
MGYTFSSDTNDITLKDIDITSKISEDFFGMQKDPEQFQATEENKKYIFKHMQSFLNIIKNDGTIVGYSFLVPSTKEIMNSFVKGNITEADLFNKVKELKLTELNFETLYLCSAIIKKEHQLKGLALSGSVRLIESLIKKRGIQPALFFWAYSKEGAIVAKKVAKALNLNLVKKAD